MVGEDMVPRLRPLLVALATVALVVLAAPGTAAGGSSEGADDGAPAVVVTQTSSARPLAARGARSASPLPLGVVLFAVVVVAAGAAATVDRTDRRVGRRLGDDGDDWRSLLLGAPPALA
jgi:hypothetical protein